MAGQREENGKGAQSWPLLMQIAATLKESREARKVLFNFVVDLINKEERNKRDRQSFEHRILLLYPPCALI